MERSAYVLSLYGSAPPWFSVAETKEVLNMNKNQTKEQELIDVEELPVHTYLQPIRVFDGLYPEDEEERQSQIFKQAAEARRRAKVSEASRLAGE